MTRFESILVIVATATTITINYGLDYVTNSDPHHIENLLSGFVTGGLLLFLFTRGILRQRQ